jgi:hypothetical protein
VGLNTLLSALPDYATLLGGTDLLPIDDFELVLIATGDPLDVTATFLAARMREPARVRAALTGRSLSPGDPRLLRYLSDDLAVLARPDDAALLDAAKADGGTAPDAPETRWRAQLARLEQAAPAPDEGALSATLSDAPSLLRFGAGLPTPDELALAASADPSPAVRFHARFARPADAERFAAAWPDILRRWRSSAGFLGLGSALDGLSLTRHEQSVDVTGRIPEGQVRLALELARAFLPPPESRAVDGGSAPR